MQSSIVAKKLYHAHLKAKFDETVICPVKMTYIIAKRIIVSPKNLFIMLLYDIKILYIYIYIYI